jgi:alkylation response protein AidB-like acyl-CoA dehydrogenase
MDFNLTEVQQAWREKARSLGSDLAADAAPADVVMGAARVGLLDPRADLVAAAAAIDTLAYDAASAGVALALHVGVMLALGADERFTGLSRGETVGAIALSTDNVPTEADGRVNGRASLVGPLTDRGIAVIGVRSGQNLVASAIPLDASGVSIEGVETSALRGFVCGNVVVADVAAIPLGATLPFMTRVRILLAAAGLGMGRRALHEALDAAHALRGRGAGGEQTVQGLLADAATELDAAMLLTWKAASSPAPSLADASMAKLAATEATLRAVARATQVIGVDSFRRGHIIESLTQDVRALELFAGRTEALREAVAADILPSPG